MIYWVIVVLCVDKRYICKGELGVGEGSFSMLFI